jgi:Toprim domain
MPPRPTGPSHPNPGDPVLDLALIDHLTGGRLGRFDVPCPACGPWRRARANRRRRVLRIWRLDPSFSGYHCARCGARGHVRDAAVRVDPAALAMAREEAVCRERAHAAGRLRTARHLWSRRKPIEGSPAERYLREARGVRAPLPATLGFLPARGNHGPAMIAAFGLPSEPEPGLLAIDSEEVAGVHITRLAPDGRHKAGTMHDKIMIGLCVGAPIVVAPVNDGLGLAICEGIEDALSIHHSTGLGAWGAGSASRLPALAPAVPGWVEAVTILVDDDDAGWRFSAELAAPLDARGMEVTRTVLPRRDVGVAA